MDVWAAFWSDLTSLIAAHGLLTVAAIVLIKSAGVPLPVPADLMVVLVGVQARQGRFPLLPAWLLLSAATAGGAGLLYGFTCWIGPEALIRYGHYIGLSQQRLESAEAALHDRGQRAIFVSRVVPGLRLAIVVVCGMLNIPRRTFLPAVCLAALAYVGACLGLGYVFGPPLVDALGQLVFPVGLVVPLAAVGILLVWLVRARRSFPGPAERRTVSRASQVRAGALAGALAIGGSTMVVDFLIYLGGPPAVALLATPGTIRAVTGGLLAEVLYLLGSIAVVVVMGIVWGAIYGATKERWLPAWPDGRQGLAFGVLPLAMSLLLLAPLGVAPGGAPSGATWLVAALGEAIRWVIYGALLGLIYPVLRARRAAKDSTAVAGQPRPTPSGAE
jgi:membrane protein DedA with SNARE-associated domain